MDEDNIRTPILPPPPSLASLRAAARLRLAEYDRRSDNRIRQCYACGEPIMHIRGALCLPCEAEHSGSEAIECGECYELPCRCHEHDHKQGSFQ